MSTFASYACHPNQSRGRLFKESAAQNRSCFQRDRDRIVHTGAFRKLEYKTQVFVNHEGDYYRTRLTHTLEVAQIARSLARALDLNEDLTEALALAHDLGHTPFGHAGEWALDEVMAPWGGFDHNIQALRILTSLEKRYADFDGLNLTWETLEGAVKHNGPLCQPYGESLTEYLKIYDLEVNTHASLEAQVAAISDDIAYNNHDIDDGLRAGLFTADDLLELPLVGPIFKGMRQKHQNTKESIIIHESIREMIGQMVADVLATTTANLDDLKPVTVEDVRHAGQTIVDFSKKMEEKNKILKIFLRDNMYRHYKVNRMTTKAQKVVTDLFVLFFDQPACLPTDWKTRYDEAPEQKRKAVVVADYIAGMTDRYAMLEHQRLYDMYTKND